MTVPTPHILHEADVTAVIGDKVNAFDAAEDLRNDAEFAKRGAAVIASPTADAVALKVAVDLILAALTASGVTA